MATPDTEDVNLFVNAGVPIGTLELYGFGSYGHRDGLSAANYRQQSAAANRDYSTITPATTPTAANFVPLTPDGFLPFIDTTLEDYAATLGLRGDLGSWHADFSIGYGHNSFDYTVRNSLNTSFGTASQSVFDAGGLDYGQTVANLDFSRQYEIGFATPLSVAVGAEYRNENFGIRPGDTPVVRDRSPVPRLGGDDRGRLRDARRRLQCRHRHLQLPGPRRGRRRAGLPRHPDQQRDRCQPPQLGRLCRARYQSCSRGSRPSLAGRFEHFSDFGSTFNGKLALRYEPVHGFALRGSISNGFRAPSLHQQFFTTTSTNFINGLPVDISTLAVSSPVARALGSRDLEPEKSVNLSFGATANPVRGLTLTVDYYRIDIDNRIVLTENLGAAGAGTPAVNAAVKALLDANGFQSVGAARFFVNGLDTTTHGIDAVATYHFRTEGLGNWTLTAAYNYNRTAIQRRLNNLGPLATIPGIVLFGRVEGIRFTDGQPRDKIVLSADGDARQFRPDRAHHPLRLGDLAGRDRAAGRSAEPYPARPGRHPSRRQVDHRSGASLPRLRPSRSRGRRRQRLRRLSGSLAVRRAAGVGRRGLLSDQPILPALFGLLALRLQRPLPLRAGVRDLLTTALAGAIGDGCAQPSPLPRLLRGLNLAANAPM